MSRGGARVADLRYVVLGCNNDTIMKQMMMMMMMMMMVTTVIIIIGFRRSNSDLQ